MWWPQGTNPSNFEGTRFWRSIFVAIKFITVVSPVSAGAEVMVVGAVSPLGSLNWLYPTLYCFINQPASGTSACSDDWRICCLLITEPTPNISVAVSKNFCFWGENFIIIYSLSLVSISSYLMTLP